MDENDYILIINPTWEDDSRSESNTTKIKIDDLTKEVQDFYNKISQIFCGLKEPEINFRLDEIEIKAEVTASGKIGFCGSGVEAGINAGISFKLVRKS